MPTGYTAGLHDGTPTTFPEFAMQCARAFGALITMRDSGADATIPGEFQPEPYYRDNHAQAKARLAEVQGWDLATAQEESQREYDTEAARIAKSNAEDDARRERYEAMLAEVEAWTPPTPDHAEMKTFMIGQLTGSIKFDCTLERQEPARLPGAAYKAQQEEHARKQAAYYATEYAKEVERAAGRTEWVRALRESLTPQSAEA